MPTVPNLSLGYNVPTFDLGTGITNTTAATNMLSPFMDNREIVNQDLIQQMIEANAAKVSPVMYDEFPPGFSFRPQGPFTKFRNGYFL
jgi:hypothetical protein